MEPAWPDLGHNSKNKSRFLSSSSKEDDKSSKSKSCESSDEESPALPQDSTAPTPSTNRSPPPIPPLDQTRPRSGQPIDNEDSNKLETSIPLNHTTEPGWFERDHKINVSNNFFEEDDLGFDPFHETQKGLADLLESESKAAEAQQKQVVTPEPEWKNPQPLNRTRAPPPGFHAPAISQPAPYNFLPEHSINRVMSSGVDPLFGRGQAPLHNRSGLPA